jgi:transposase
MQQSSTLSIGMDVHKDSIAVAYVAPDHGAEVTSLGALGTRQCDIDQRVRTMPSKATPLIFVDDAGPGGDWLDRDRTTNGYDGWGVAPAWIPHTPGDRVNTDRRDARPLARLARAGALTVVDVPKVADAASRDLSRAREDAISDRNDAKCRLNAVWLRQAIRDVGRANGGPAPRRWLAEVVCPPPAQPLVCQASGHAVQEHAARLQRLEQARQAQVTSWRLNPVVAALQALRGVQVTVAVTMVAAIGDLTRVATPRALMKCLGLIPGGIHPCRATPARVDDQSREHPGPQGAGRRRLGLSRARKRQSTSAPATGKTPSSDPGHQVDSSGPAVSTLPPTPLTRHTPQRGHRGHGP